MGEGGCREIRCGPFRGGGISRAKDIFDSAVSHPMPQCSKQVARIRHLTRCGLGVCGKVRGRVCVRLEVCVWRVWRVCVEGVEGVVAGGWLVKRGQSSVEVRVN